jgi:hypothetical protein
MAEALFEPFREKIKVFVGPSHTETKKRLQTDLRETREGAMTAPPLKADS